jgi:hypothetical protein
MSGASDLEFQNQKGTDMKFAFAKQTEKRRFARVDISGYAYISYKGRTYRAQVQDLSTQAMKLVTDAPVPLDDVAEIVVNSASGVTSFYGKVARATLNGLVFSEGKSNGTMLSRLFFTVA